MARIIRTARRDGPAILFFAFLIGCTFFV